MKAMLAVRLFFGRTSACPPSSCGRRGSTPSSTGGQNTRPPFLVLGYSPRQHRWPDAVTPRRRTSSPQQKGTPHVQFPDQHASAGFSRRPLRRLHTRKWTAFWYAPVAGFVVAGLTWLFAQAVVTLVFGGPFFDVHSYLDWLRPVVWPYGTLGALVASFLWLLAR